MNYVIKDDIIYLTSVKFNMALKFNNRSVKECALYIIAGKFFIKWRKREG